MEWESFPIIAELTAQAVSDDILRPLDTAVGSLGAKQSGRPGPRPRLYSELCTCAFYIASYEYTLASIKHFRNGPTEKIKDLMNEL